MLTACEQSVKTAPLAPADRVSSVTRGLAVTIPAAGRTCRPRGRRTPSHAAAIEQPARSTFMTTTSDAQPDLTHPEPTPRRRFRPWQWLIGAPAGCRRCGPGLVLRLRHAGGAARPVRRRWRRPRPRRARRRPGRAPAGREAAGPGGHGREAQYRRGAEGARHGDPDQHGHGAQPPRRRTRAGPLHRGTARARGPAAGRDRRAPVRGRAGAGAGQQGRERRPAEQCPRRPCDLPVALRAPADSQAAAHRAGGAGQAGGGHRPVQRRPGEQRQAAAVLHADRRAASRAGSGCGRWTSATSFAPATPMASS